jgi:glycosyltransferase involved in cell wall biosynthesis
MNATGREVETRSAAPDVARAPVTVIVLTFNEERNLAACLESVAGWARAIFVVDSGSTDKTVQIADAQGATVVTHPFETHAR